MERQTFRQASCFALVGVVIAFVGAIISGIAIYHLASGTPLVQGGSKLSGGQHLASSAELWTGILGGIPFLVLGILILLSTVNSTISIDGEGIVARNLFRRISFQSSWQELESVERIDKSSASGYVLKSKGQTLKIQSSVAGMKTLIAEIQRLHTHS